MKRTFEVVDMFCGAGGESTGIFRAAEAQNMKVHLTAINHWERAIETHSANHPYAEHYCQSIESLDPAKVIPKGKVNLLWASPECTHHSVARGGRPRSNQSRASAWLILKWLQDLYVERVIIENVPEFLSWGPLDSKGQPVKSKKGEMFNAFIYALQSMGYAVDWKILCAADYGDPTTRRRLFIQAVKGRKRIVWPEITHMDKDGVNLMGYKPWRPAREIIDWSIPGTSIFDRKRPLAAATMRRIVAGIEKYWGEYARPFLAILRGTGLVESLDDPLSSVTCSGAHHALVQPVPMVLGQQSGSAARPVDMPIPTVAGSAAISVVQPMIMGHETGQMPRPVDQPIGTILAQGRKMLIEPFITRYHGDHKGQQDGDSRNHDIKKPLPVVDTSNRYGIVEPIILPNEGFYRGNKARTVDDPLNTVTSRGAGAIVEPLIMEYYGNGGVKPVSEPVGTVTTKDRFALLQGSLVKLDILFRMLKPDEVKQGQGFSREYIIKGNQAEQMKQIGNAVPPGTAAALAEAAMSA